MPESDGYTVTPQRIASGTGKVALWVLDPKRSPTVGTVVFCHGNGGNLDDHVSFVDFLPEHGYRVLMFDYRGYGESTPIRISRESTSADVEAVIAHATAQWGKPWLMGHSLGASLAIVAAGTRPDTVRGVIAVAPFTSYRGVARSVLERHSSGATAARSASSLVSTGHEPIDAVPRISPTPLLLVHGGRDDLIPPEHSQQLYDHAGQPKDLLIVPHAGHNTPCGEKGRRLHPPGRSVPSNGR